MSPFIQSIYELLVIRCWLISKSVCKENNEDIFFGFNKINENLMLISETRIKVQDVKNASLNNVQVDKNIISFYSKNCFSDERSNMSYFTRRIFHNYSLPKCRLQVYVHVFKYFLVPTVNWERNSLYMCKPGRLINSHLLLIQSLRII